MKPQRIKWVENSFDIMVKMVSKFKNQIGAYDD